MTDKEVLAWKEYLRKLHELEQSLNKLEERIAEREARERKKLILELDKIWAKPNGGQPATGLQN